MKISEVKDYLDSIDLPPEIRYELLRKGGSKCVINSVVEHVIHLTNRNTGKTSTYSFPSTDSEISERTLQEYLNDIK